VGPLVTLHILEHELATITLTERSLRWPRRQVGMGDSGPLSVEEG